MLFSGFRVCKMNIRSCKLSYTAAYSSVIVVWQKKKKKKMLMRELHALGLIAPLNMFWISRHRRIRGLRKGGRDGKREEEGVFDLLFNGLHRRGELQPRSWASGPTRAAAAVAAAAAIAASEAPSSVTQATKTPTSTVSMKLQRRSVNSKSIF